MVVSLVMMMNDRKGENVTELIIPDMYRVRRFSA